MLKGENESDHDKLFTRIDLIGRRRTAGSIMPILWKLAVAGDPDGQTELARMLTAFEPDELPKNRVLAKRWLLRAAARGHSSARYNLAMTYRNAGRMGGYRYWLVRAAQIDPTESEELKKFRTRFPHPVMRRWHRFASER